MGTYRYHAILASIFVLVGLSPPHAGAAIYRCTTPAKLDLCPPDILQGILGENWKDFDPVGVCTKGFFLIHTRHGKVFRDLTLKQVATTTGYAAFMYQIGAGLWIELEKVR